MTPAIELYRKGFASRGVITEKEVEDTEREHPEETPYQIIERVIRDKIANETSNMRLYSLYSVLRYAVYPQKNAEKTAAVDAEIERLAPLYWEEFYSDREKSRIAAAEKLGLSLEEMQKIDDAAKEQLRQECLSDGMTDKEFDLFVEEQCAKFKTEGFANEFRRIAYKNRETHNDEYFSLKNRLLHTVKSMLKSEKYHS